MIQPPRGQINVDAQNCFPSQYTENYMSPEIDTTTLDSSDTSPLQLNNPEIDNQLVCSNRIRDNLNPQVTRQVAFSNNLLIIRYSIRYNVRYNFRHNSRYKIK